MLRNIKKGMLPTLIALSALSVSASAAFYSVFGLSKLFAGASTEVIIMAGSLEFAKLVVASLLYQYWEDINKILRTYLSIATFILILITSMGIYGFLSAAYQETYSKLTVNENRIEFLQQKEKFYQDDVNRYDKDLELISSNIATLSNAKSQAIQVRDTLSATGFRNTISTTELRLSQQRLAVEEQNRVNIQSKRSQAADSLQKYQLEILELENNTEIAGELGPLKYLAGLTGSPMDQIINILLLVIIFVFDPLAVAMVIAANFAFSRAFPEKKYRDNLYGEKVEVNQRPIVNTLLEEEKEIEKLEEKGMWDNERMEIIGQNGNDGIHYEEEKIEKEPAEDFEDNEKLQEERSKIINSAMDDIVKSKASSTPLDYQKRKVQEVINKLNSLEDKIY